MPLIGINLMFEPILFLDPLTPILNNIAYECAKSTIDVLIIEKIEILFIFRDLDLPIIASLTNYSKYAIIKYGQD